MAKVWIAKFIKGGNVIEVEINANNQAEAKKIAENMRKSMYPDRKLNGTPQQKR